MTRAVRMRLALAGMAFAVLLCGTEIVFAQESDSPSDKGQMNGTELKKISQSPAPPPSDNAMRKYNWGAQAVRDLAGDQKALWSSPKNIRVSDFQWLVPLAGATAAFIETDSSYSRHLSHDPVKLSNYNKYSNVGIAALAGGAGALWALSH